MSNDDHILVVQDTGNGGFVVYRALGASAPDTKELAKILGVDESRLSCQSTANSLRKPGDFSVVGADHRSGRAAWTIA